MSCNCVCEKEIENKCQSELGCLFEINDDCIYLTSDIDCLNIKKGITYSELIPILTDRICENNINTFVESGIYDSENSDIILTLNDESEVTIDLSSISPQTYTVDNGLNSNTPNNFRLGGNLVETTNINGLNTHSFSFSNLNSFIVQSSASGLVMNDSIQMSSANSVLIGVGSTSTSLLSNGVITIGSISSSEIRLSSPNIHDFSASNGNVWTLIDQATGEGEWSPLPTDENDFVTNVILNGINLEFTGTGSAFSGVVDLSSLSTELQARNGLNVDSGFVELGGVLIENTLISSTNFDLDFNFNDGGDVQVFTSLKTESENSFSTGVRNTSDSTESVLEIEDERNFSLYGINNSFVTPTINGLKEIGILGTTDPLGSEDCYLEIFNRTENADVQIEKSDVCFDRDSVRMSFEQFNSTTGVSERRARINLSDGFFNITANNFIDGNNSNISGSETGGINLTTNNVPINITPQGNAGNEGEYLKKGASGVEWGLLTYNITNIGLGNYNVQLTDDLIQKNAITVGGDDIVLPSGVVTGKRIIIKDASGNASSNNITVTTAGVELIDGQASVVITQSYQSKEFYFDGTNYYTV